MWQALLLASPSEGALAAEAGARTPLARASTRRPSRAMVPAAVRINDEAALVRGATTNPTGDEDATRAAAAAALPPGVRSSATVELHRASTASTLPFTKYHCCAAASAAGWATALCARTAIHLVSLENDCSSVRTHEAAATPPAAGSPSFAAATSSAPSVGCPRMAPPPSESEALLHTTPTSARRAMWGALAAVARPAEEWSAAADAAALCLPPKLPRSLNVAK